MTNTVSFEEAKQAIRVHVAARTPSAQVEEVEEKINGRRYAVLRVSSNGRRVEIYTYDDGDFGFTTEDGEWFPLEIWDEKDDKRRLDRLFRMLEVHTSMFSRPSI